MPQPLIIAGREFSSRLFLGTGKFPSNESMRDALDASGTQIVTVALRRADLTGTNDPYANILEYIDSEKYLLLPNTSGAMNAEEAVRLARLAAAAGLPKWVKLEIHPDPTYLLPDPIETLKAAEILVKEGFTVLPYINADPVPPGRYRIASVPSGLCIEVRDGSTANGTPLVQSACEGTLHRQFFDIAETTAGQYRLRNLATQKSADIPAASGADHVIVQQWDDNGSGAQRFRLQRVDTSDRYRIVNVNSGKCIGIVGASTTAASSPGPMTTLPPEGGSHI